MRVKSTKTARQALALLAVALVATMIFSPLISVKAASGAATGQSEYTQFVHTYINSTKGNWTSVEKPMFPLNFNDSQIAIGANWSIVEPLVAGHNYHVYCYGAWVNNGSQPKTDYDIYVYNPNGIMESEHTEAAGLPEHLGTLVNDTFFTPAMTGNYTFVIINDARESMGAQQATFMAIENVETDQWFTASMEGEKADGSAALDTSWAYEFTSDQPKIEVYVKVPNTLDMYEARLYVMSNQSSLIINDAPLPWEPGLYGNLTGSLGGYNLNSNGYRGVAYASCEYKGEDMYFCFNATALNANTTSTASKPTTKGATTATNVTAANATMGKTLYQLVLIGEVGAGKVDVLVKTQFSGACLIASNSTKLINRVSPNNETTIAYVSNSTDIAGASLSYTADNWNSSQMIPMKIQNRTITAVIPKQKAGTTVNYCVVANDTLMNTLTANGTFTVKQFTSLNISVAKSNVYLGDNVTVQGVLTGAKPNASVEVMFMNPNKTIQFEVTTLKNGTFTLGIPANSTGNWSLEATFGGDDTAYPAFADMILVKVQEQPFYVKNGLFIGGGGFFGIVALVLVYYMKKRRQ